MRAKLKELTKDTAIYGISTIIGRFLGFLLTPFYTNVLLPGDYGIFSNVYAYIAFINILFIYGMDAAYMKFASVSEEVDRKRKVFSTSYLFVAGTSLLFCLVLYFVMNPMKSLMELPEKFSSIYFYFIGILLLDTLALIPFADLRLKRKAVKFSTIKFGNILILLQAEEVDIPHFLLYYKVSRSSGAVRFFPPQNIRDIFHYKQTASCQYRRSGLLFHKYV